MSDEYYMQDDRSKTVEGVIEALTILSKYMTNGMQERFFCGAEHDELFFYVDVSKCPENSEDGQRLSRLGFHVSDDFWAYFT